MMNGDMFFSAACRRSGRGSGGRVRYSTRARSIQMLRLSTAWPKMRDIDVKRSRELQDGCDRWDADSALDLREKTLGQAGALGQTVQAEFPLTAHRMNAPGDSIELARRAHRRAQSDFARLIGTCPIFVRACPCVC